MHSENKILLVLDLDEIPLEFVWARSKCNFTAHASSKNKNINDSSLYTKDLSVLKKYGYSMERILIVDDTPRVCIKNLANSPLSLRSYNRQAISGTSRKKKSFV